MKNEKIEFLDFDDTPKVGRPRLADKRTKKKSLIIASISFIAVILLLVFGYGTLFGFKNLNLRGSLSNNDNSENVLITEIKPIVKNITLKAGTARKVYLSVLPASATNKDITYVSSNENVAVVDEKGKVTGVSNGNAVITASTMDGSNLNAAFNVTVIKNIDGKCTFTSLDKLSEKVDYNISCNNAVVKEVQYKVGNRSFEKLLTKKLADSIPFSKEELNKNITFKVVYYPNSSKITKYSLKTLNVKKKTTTSPKGSCNLEIKEVKANSAKYDVSCSNASVTKIAYKIGNGSYIGVDTSSLADTVLFEESDITRQIYFNIQYKIDGTNKIGTVSKSSIIERASSVNNVNESDN